MRDAVKRKYGLPDDELCGTTTCTSYLPSYVPLVFFPECTACAGYQMAYYMKHEAPNKSDFQCCCYTTFCQNPMKDDARLRYINGDVVHDARRPSL